MAGLSVRVAVAVLCASCAFGESDLHSKIEERLSHFQGRVSLHAKNLKTGEEYDRNGGNRVQTASSIKLPIMIGVYTAVLEGKAKWTDTSSLSKDNKVPGSGVLQQLSDGLTLNLKDLMRLMILLRDNTATNLVLDHVSGNQVNAVMDRLGAKNTRSLRKILNKDSQPQGQSDAGKDPELKKYGIGVTTPREMVSLLERLYKGEIVSKEASAEMLDVMKKQNVREGMPRRFDGVEVADKPGSLDHFRGDVGIVFAKEGAVAIAIACEDIPQVDWSSDAAGHLALADVAKLLVDGLTGH